MLALTIVLVALPTAALVLVGFRFLTRGTPIERLRPSGSRGLPTVTDHTFRETMELHTRMPLTPGNRVEILRNGDGTYPRLFDDIRAARRSITLQMYYCQPGRLADEFHEALRERARAGVRVLFLHDAFGSQKLRGKYLDSLKDEGVEVAVFRPVHWYSLDKAYTRSHIRVAVMDGRIGYTGGLGIDDKWLGDAQDENHWRDTNVRFTGPAVAQLQATFAAGWAEATGELLTGDGFFPRPPEDDGGDGVLAGLLHCAPTIGSTVAERFLALSIASARRRLYVANSYFVPDDDFRRLLCDAAGRGVDVRVLTTGDRSDVKTTLHAGRWSYEELLRGGVRVYEYQPTMMHAKSIVSDACWSSIGTMNFDNRSLAFNDESNLAVLDERFGRLVEEMFLDDLRASREIVLDEWLRRPRMERAKQRAAATLARVL